MYWLAANPGGDVRRQMFGKIARTLCVAHTQGQVNLVCP